MTALTWREKSDTTYGLLPDLWLYIIGGVIAAAMAVVGGWVSSSKRWHRCFFVVSGLASIVIIVAVGVRNYRAQAQSERDRHELTEKVDSLRDEVRKLAQVPKSIGEVRSMLDRPVTPAPPPKTQYADVVIQLYGEKSLMFGLYNEAASETARDPKYMMGIWDYTRANPAVHDPSANDPLQIPSRTLPGEFIHPKDALGGWSLLDLSVSAKSLVKPDDLLFGFIACTCLNCSTTHAYWLFFHEGHGGWFAPANLKGNDVIPFPNQGRFFSDPVELERFIGQFIKIPRKLVIPSLPTLLYSGK